MRIDAHQHFWRYSAAEYPWIDARMQRIARDFLPADLQPELARVGIDGCLAVQAHQSLAETEFLLACARSHPFIRGVVGWMDLCAPDAGRTLARLSTEPALRGLRHVVQAEADDFLLRLDFQRGVRTLRPHGLVYELLIHHHQLAAATAFVGALPDQPFVLDHLAKPDIEHDRRTPWAGHLQALAKHPHVACKISGLVTEAKWQRWQADDFTFYLDTALEAFGPDRLLFGSDWPVCLCAAADYAAVHDLVATWAQRLTPSEQQRLFGDNTMRIYRLS